MSEHAKEKLRMEREDAIVADRIEKLKPYPQSVRSDAVLRSMSPAQFAEYLADAIKAEEDRKARAVEQAKIAEANRVTPSGRAVRSDPERIKAWEQACRSRWRALVLCVKAKLEAVAIGISTFEEEFLAHIVDPVTGQTIGQIALPRIAQSYADRTPVDLPRLVGPEQ